MISRRLLCGLLFTPALVNCSSSASSDGAPAGAGGTGNANQGGSPGTAGSSLGQAGSSIAVAANAGTGGAASSTGALSLGLYNVVTARLEPGFEPLGSVLERVELPPRFTLLAKVPEQTKSVRFSLDASDHIDSQAPFHLTEDTGGEASAWSVAFGEHEITVVAFADEGAQGATLATFTQKLELKGTGMDALFVPTDEATQTQWLNAHLNEVMVAKTFTGTVGSLPYRLYTPPQYDAAVAYPLLVFLHGRGDRGTDNRASTYASQLFHGPRSIVSPNGQAEFPSFVLVPQCSDMPSNQEWARWVGNLGSNGSYQQAPEPWPSALLVKELIESLQASQSIEQRRTYLTGESMGGFGTWEFTARWPGLFGAGVPMAGYSDPSQVGKLLKIPFWVFHGDADQSNPVAGSRAMSRAINDAGGSAQYTEYPGVDHGGTFRRAWTEEPELLPWIYSQRVAP